jgi:3-oxoacyl-[acyl-carrier protein] reductase
MDLGLRGKAVVVTGASRGIGRAIARAFAAEGSRLAICARGGDELRTAAHEFREAGSQVYDAVVDVADAAALDAFLERAHTTFGRIDVLVNNVATFNVANDEASWQEALNVTFMSYVRATTKVVPWMIETGGGSIVHNSSIAGLEAGWPATYAAAKAALLSHSKTLAAELAPAKIRVNSVAPGSIEFPGGAWDEFKRSNRTVYDRVLATVPAGRFGTPEEVANAVVFLASDRASWITGAVLTIDGGQHRGNL